MATTAATDGDDRGDACDPSDDRPDEPGVGSYEWYMASAIAWGRRPAILLRADAMSLGYRQEIAEALTEEALSRDLAFTLAVIPWNLDRYDGTAPAAYLADKVSNPNFEAAQHGTYHTCVYTEFPGTTVEEFDCGMDANRSFNLMQVGNESMTSVADFSAASHRLGGFIPPADAFDAASLEAARAETVQRPGSTARPPQSTPIAGSTAPTKRSASRHATERTTAIGSSTPRTTWRRAVSTISTATGCARSSSS
jgi:hypothetical protein